MGFLDNVKGALRDVVATRSSKQAPAAGRPRQEDIVPAGAPVETEETFETYTVKVGDTLHEISARAGASVEDIARINDIEDPDLIFPGQVFRIPVA